MIPGHWTKWVLPATLAGLTMVAAAQGGAARGRGAAAATPGGGAAQAPGGTGAQAGAQQGRGAAAATPNAGGGRGGGANGAADFYTYESTAATGIPIRDTPPVEAHDKLTLAGADFAYSVKTGYLPVRNATTGAAEAQLFFTYYSKDGVSGAANRPLLFAVGGAPGNATALEEFGGLGPKRAKTGESGLPPYAWEDNPNTLLAQSDLVFVDPVGTGFSRPETPAGAPALSSATAEAAYLAEFIRSFLSTYDRWNSPRLLLGEDASTGRTAALAGYMIDHQMPVNGVALLDLPADADAGAGDAVYLNTFPSLVMTAWFHKRLAPALNSLPADKIAAQAADFSLHEYLHALYQGERMTAEERAKVAADMARLTGLTPAFISNNDLRIAPDRFAAELLRDQHATLALSDTRLDSYTGAGGRGGRGGRGGGSGAADLGEEQRTAGFQPAYEQYLKSDLGFSDPGVFYLLNGGVGTYTGAASDDAVLAAALERDPHLQVFVGMSYFDLSLPYLATEYTLAHLAVSPEVRAHNIASDHFEAGAMAYRDPAAQAKLHADLAKFIAAATVPADK